MVYNERYDNIPPPYETPKERIDCKDHCKPCIECDKSLVTKGIKKLENEYELV